ncbi:DUF2760 domain-containing protein [Thermosulfuriphilus sp.]
MNHHNSALGFKIFVAFALLTAVMAGLGYYFKELLPPWALVLIVATPPATGCLLYGLVRSSPPKATKEPPPPSQEPKPSPPQDTVSPQAVGPSPEAVIAQVLATFQREGRLLDFLSEDLDRYDDAQIGAAVRVIHRGLKSALSEMVHLAPVVEGQEGAEVTVEEGFDPSAIRLTGNVQGKPPFKGILRHRGWRYLEIKSPPLSEEKEQIITPAEIEIR